LQEGNQIIKAKFFRCEAYVLSWKLYTWMEKRY
jgi:hypothetical protein